MRDGHRHAGASMRHVSPRDLAVFASDVLAAAGMPVPDAATVAECLLTANLRAVDGHGVLRVIQYVDTIRRGEVEAAPAVEVVANDAGRAMVDAGGGYGYVPTLLASDLAAQLGRGHGVGVVAVRNSHHFGMAGIYAERIARERMIGIVVTNTGPIMAPPGVSRPVVGNNPIAVSVPRRSPHSPILLDMALSQTAFGRIRLAAAEGRAIPLGWALDVDGRPTTDAREALEAGLLSPVGEHKGLGLALMIDLLAGVLTGSPSGRRADAHGSRSGGVGHLVIAIAPGLFVAESEFLHGVEQMVEDYRAAGSAERPLLLPGEPEFSAEAERSQTGVPVSDALAAQLVALAGELGVQAPPALAED